MTRLLVDVMCGRLATYLRMCGYDAAYALDRDAESDEAVLSWAREEDRTVVTRDERLAAAAPAAICLTSRDVRDQLAELRDAGLDLTLPDEPTRCSRCNGDLVRKLIRDGTVSACHDLSDGGLFVALAEMALAGDLGCEFAAPDDTPLHAWLFGEDQARYLVAAPQAAPILEASAAAGVPAAAIGRTGGDSLKLSDGRAISLADLRAVHEQWLPAYMQAEG